jgi:hypothetical protein
VPLLGVSADDLFEDGDELGEDASDLLLARCADVVGDLRVARRDDLIMSTAGADEENRHDRSAVADGDVDHPGWDRCHGTKELDGFTVADEVALDGHGDNAVAAQRAVDVAHRGGAEAARLVGVAGADGGDIDGDHLDAQPPARPDDVLEEACRLEHFGEHGHAAAEAMVPRGQSKLPRAEVQRDDDHAPTTLQGSDHVLDVDRVHTGRGRVSTVRQLHDVDPCACQVAHVGAHQPAKCAIVGVGQDAVKVVAQADKTPRLSDERGIGDGGAQPVGDAMGHRTNHRLTGAIGDVGKHAAHPSHRTSGTSGDAGGVEFPARVHHRLGSRDQPALGVADPAGAASLTAAALARPLVWALGPAMNSSVCCMATASDTWCGGDFMK